MLKGPAVCLCTVITHSEFLSLPRTLMLTSIYFLEIHLHTVAQLNLNLNQAFVIKMNEDLPTEVGHNNVTT